MFYWQDRRDLKSGSLMRCFTDALGGVSEAPFSGLNLGDHVGDSHEAVARNRALAAGGVGQVPVSWLNQVHGSDVKVVHPGNVDDVVSADAQVTDAPGIALAVMVADCTPVLFSDEKVGVIGVAHAGRPGMMAGVIPATLEAMRRLGASDIEAIVGPSVCGRCYEVPEALREAAGLVTPEARAVTWTGTPAIDVASAVVSQLRQEDVAITWVPGCTVENADLYSYRRDGQTGRLAGLISRVPS